MATEKLRLCFVWAIRFIDSFLLLIHCTSTRGHFHWHIVCPCHRRNRNIVNYYYCTHVHLICDRF
jgi:hypothetical protein